MNSHVVYGFTEADDESTFPSTRRVDIGLSLYPMLPLLNHSCHPNTIRLNVGSRVVVVAAEDIRAGDEVTDSYGQNCLVAAREERRRRLRDNYNFTCHCRY